MENGHDVSNVEVEERELIETEPAAGGLVSLNTKENAQDLIAFAEIVEQVIQAQNKIRMAILKLTHPADWMIFNKTAEIGFAPSNRIGCTMGVSYTNWSAEKVIGTDDRGAWYRWEYQADATWRTMTIRVYGRAGSRDKFFGKKDGEFKELHDIDEGNIKMAAMRACKKEGVKDLFGLHHLDPEYLKKYGINLESASGYSFKNQDEKAEETQTATIKVLKITKKSDEKGKWTKFTIWESDSKGYSTFSELFAKEADRLAKEGKQAMVNFKNGKYGAEIVSIGEAQ